MSDEVKNTTIIIGHVYKCFATNAAWKHSTNCALINQETPCVFMDGDVHRLWRENQTLRKADWPNDQQPLSWQKTVCVLVGCFFSPFSVSSPEHRDLKIHPIQSTMLPSSQLMGRMVWQHVQETESSIVRRDRRGAITWDQMGFRCF